MDHNCIAHLVTSFFIFCLLSGFGFPLHAQDQRPNILIAISDDHSYPHASAYGALDYGLRLDHTPTPHIDRLAEGRMRFDNAFVTNSICRPSRAVLLSGLHSHLNGVLTNSESLPAELETFPKLLQQSGYQTAMIGKWHLVSEPRGFDYYEVLYGQGPYYNPTIRSSCMRVTRVSSWAKKGGLTSGGSMRS